jgi:hypothetical protein
VLLCLRGVSRTRRIVRMVLRRRTTRMSQTRRSQIGKCAASESWNSRRQGAVGRWPRDRAGARTRAWRIIVQAHGPEPGASSCRRTDQSLAHQGRLNASDPPPGYLMLLRVSQSAAGRNISSSQSAGLPKMLLAVAARRDRDCGAEDPPPWRHYFRRATQELIHALL